MNTTTDIKWFEETMKVGSYFCGNCEVVTAPAASSDEKLALYATAQNSNLPPAHRTSGLQSEGL